MIYVTLRFDDGTITQYTNAFRYMKRFDMPGSIYVIGSKLSEVNGPSYIKIEQLLEMQDAGWEIGYHSWSHSKDWINDPNTYHQETDKRALETSGIRVTTFALPYSLYNKEVLDHLSLTLESGDHNHNHNHNHNTTYDGSYKGIVGIPSKMGDSMVNMPTNCLFRSYTITRSTKLDTIISRINEAITANEYLILLFHKIERASKKGDHLFPKVARPAAHAQQLRLDSQGEFLPKSNPWSMPLKRFQKIIKVLDTLQKQGFLQVLTLDNAINFLSSG